MRWEEARRGWLSVQSQIQPKPQLDVEKEEEVEETKSSAVSFQKPQHHAIPLDVDEIIDVIFSQRWRLTHPTAPTLQSPSPQSLEGNGGTTTTTTTTTATTRLEDTTLSFSQPVPLPQMVDILVDLWEAEGLDI